MFAALLALAVGATDARAAVTNTTVTTPSTPELGSLSVSPSGVLESVVAGTSDGSSTTSDKVNVACFSTSSAGTLVKRDVATDLPVGADGAWSASTFLAKLVVTGPCYLAAYPRTAPATSPTADQLGTSYAGLALRGLTTAGFHANSGDTTRLRDYVDDLSTPRAFLELNSMASCGIGYSSPYVAQAALLQQQARHVFYCNDFYMRNQQTAQGAYRSGVRVDGQDAYFATDAAALQSAGPWPGLTVERSYDPATRELTIVERDTLSRCAANVPNAPTNSANCGGLTVTDVSVERTIRTSHQGLVVAITDVWKTAGAERLIDLLSNESFPRTPGGAHRLPGESAFAVNSTAFRTVAIPSSESPQALLYAGDATGGDGPASPHGSIAMWPVPDSATFTRADNGELLLHHAFTIPAGGSYTFKRIYAQELTGDALAPLTEEALAALTPAAPSPAPPAAPPTSAGEQPTEPTPLDAPFVGPAGGGGNDLEAPAPDRAPAIDRNGTVSCPAGGPTCTVATTWTSVRRFGRRGSRKPVLLARESLRVPAGARKTVTPRLTTRGRTLLRAHRRLGAVRVVRAAAGSATTSSKRQMTLVR